MKRLILFLLFCASLASAQLVIRNPGLLAALQPATAATAWSSNNMTLWLVADDLTALSDNSIVGLWTNRISGRLGFTNAFGTGIVKSNNIANSHAVVHFPGSSEELTSENPSGAGTNWNAFVGANDASFIFVIRQRSTDAQNAVIGWSDGADMIQAYATYDDVLYFDWVSVASGRISGAQPAGWDNTFHVLELLHTSGASVIAVDGTNAATGAISTTFTTAGKSNWYFGSDSAAGIEITGEIAEVRWFNIRVSDSERDLHGAELSTRYGTPPYSRP